MRNEDSTERVNKFHILYYDCGERTWQNTFWLGVPALKCPLDLWTYQEIIYETRPDIIVECGTANGGGALFLASICDLVRNGRVITVDTKESNVRPRHERITYLTGSTVDEETVGRIRRTITGADKVMVILDSDHTKDHVRKELRLYSDLVTVGNYLIVEDTNINGHPVLKSFGPGPMEAVQEFLAENEDFIIDKSREKFFMTFNPEGYLKRVKRTV
jgi:cephalosporin hydroxylase